MSSDLLTIRTTGGPYQTTSIPEGIEPPNIYNGYQIFSIYGDTMATDGFEALTGYSTGLVLRSDLADALVPVYWWQATQDGVYAISWSADLYTHSEAGSGYKASVKFELVEHEWVKKNYSNDPNVTGTRQVALATVDLQAFFGGNSVATARGSQVVWLGVGSGFGWDLFNNGGGQYDGDTRIAFQVTLLQRGGTPAVERQGG
jgi:hypothetical protein